MKRRGFVRAALASGLALMTKPADSTQQSLVERLGYKRTDKLLIIHADDVGMCHSVNMATIRAMEQGVVSSASIMVPCPWMPEIAKYSREHPEADFGLHLTLTSEWQHYRWRPVTAIGEVPGLLDAEGFMHRDVAGALGKASAAEVEKEIRNQILRARQFGINPTHVDSHMGTLFTGKFFGTYLKVATEENVMPMLPAAVVPDRTAINKLTGLDPEKAIGEARRQGFVVIDLLNTGENGTLDARREQYYNFIRNLKPGVTEIIVHLSLDDDEIRNITGNWRARWNEFQIFTDPKTRELIESPGLKRIGYKDLRKLWKP